MVAGLYDSFSSPDTMALVISIVIFLVTTGMLLFRILGFAFAGALLFFSLASGFAISKNQVVKTFLAEKVPADQQAKFYDEINASSQLESVKEKIVTIFDTVVNALANQPDKPTAGPTAPQKVRSDLTDLKKEKERMDRSTSS
ncbi:MAG: hypothetical protein Q8K75_04075 [Chlamydiales bacterium]|nr:hypothetical protein [Chlamydiales bacterium]